MASPLAMADLAEVHCSDTRPWFQMGLSAGHGEMVILEILKTVIEPG
ncbi:MAG: hypothetical protein H6Q04_2721 [Acidobacteria bacterium]|nr:hypothetical protein [Acidobacteriota bacterium]